MRLLGPMMTESLNESREIKIVRKNGNGEKILDSENPQLFSSNGMSGNRSGELQ